MDEHKTTIAEHHGNRALDLLKQLVRQPSIAAQHQGIREMAVITESLLAEAGFATQQLSIEGAPPIIYGEQRGRNPYTLLLYNHYDVQPADPLELWESPPFEPTVRGGKLYARGVSDNKGEIAVRLAAVEALRQEDGTLPITIRWIIEGEEEIGSTHFGDIIRPHADRLKADGCFWEGMGFEGQSQRPLLMLGVKGMLYVELGVRCLARDAHSGTAAILPSAAWRLVQALASLRDRSGRVLIPGFYDAVRQPTADERAALADNENVEEELRQIYGIERFVDGLTGDALRERSAFGPTCNIAGLWSGYTGEGVKTVLPAEAGAKIDFRLVPDQDPDTTLTLLHRHLQAEGFDDVRVRVLGTAEPSVTPMDDPFARRILDLAGSFSAERPMIVPVLGGSLPLLGALRRYVGVPGLGAPTNASYLGSSNHAPNEHIRLADLQRAVEMTIHLFRGLGVSVAEKA
jgi:acetylornithine deacetylase/succinyl-diaminopimelate desuccinylase-like protein